ncbi:restriction endonuclease subunit S [Pseudomonas sp. Choline-02u-1]|jgi:type I restriction enzyme S subunit|uniref:restriction endonuclease subunit S n=1 Tax=Pseudomonas sp. Choline-02u-1 TaxID=2058307 RepID=UPI000C34AA5A|nr:restriction endonuclease subunit S [Pseudomonas sp. Choline-02u-1]PKH79081.1 restriction endonuclease subunit S [Pseudomonas sp. Choline-02u-1]
MFSPYPNYQRTGLKWFEHLPESWAVLRTKQMFRLIIEKAPANNRMELLSVYTHIGVRPRKSLEQRGNKASTTDGYWVVKKGDIICNKLLAWMGAIGVSHYEGVTSPAYDILRPIKSCNTDYYHFLFRTKKYLQQFKLRSRGIMDMRLRLYFDQFGQIAIPVPPPAEQDQIVAYLRAQDTQIARFIKVKRDLIKLLTEQKLRIIDHAVTRGLAPSVRLKPSGIKWLGNVPEHWEVKPLKRWVRLNTSTLGEKTNPDFEFRYVDIGSVQTGRLAKELERIRFESAPSRARRVLRRGDTIISTVRTYLKAIWYVSEDADDLIASTGFAVLTPGTSVEPEYLGYVIQSSAFVNRVVANSIGIAYPAIAETVLGRFPVALPSTVDEQQAIVAHIKTESAPLDDAIARTEQEIKLIREYRDRLIADVVTGQVDVRGWQPGPDDVMDDAALGVLGDAQEDVTEEEDSDGED